MTQAYPLQWPQARPRTKVRRPATFGKRAPGVDNSTGKASLTIADALRRLQDEIDRLGAREYVLSSNLQARLDGLPRSGQAEPADPGVALYFHLNGKPHCLPCDTYDRAADNIAAIAKHIEATRAIERYGVATIAEMFTGFAALPSPDGVTKRTWRQVFGIQDGAPVSRRTLMDLFRKIAAERHPDKPGGSHDLMSELNRARDEALKEIGDHP